MSASATVQNESGWSLLWEILRAVISISLTIMSVVFFFMGVHNGVIGNYQRACYFLLLSISFELSASKT